MSRGGWNTRSGEIWGTGGIGLFIAGCGVAFVGGIMGNFSVTILGIGAAVVGVAVVALPVLARLG